jgi:nifR3 family TIM-barrel protein
VTQHPLLEPITIRGLTLPNRILQAPLAGYSNAPFRLLCRRLGDPGLVATEMISAKALVLGNPHNAFYLHREPGEGPVQYQLWGTEPAALEAAVRICEEHGADAVDLNCGCPVRKVNASGAGVKLMTDPPLIARCVEAMRRGTDLPVSVKIRVGPDAQTFNCIEVGRLAADAGVDFLTIHGRHGKERYATPVRAEWIRRVVEDLHPLPVIANGDVCDGETADRLHRLTDAAGVMVGRACMGDPWVFARIRAELKGEVFVEPGGAERGSVLLEHYRRLVEIMGEYRATRHVRKLAAFYSRGLAGSRRFRTGLNQCRDAESFTAHVREHFGLPA